MPVGEVVAGIALGAVPGYLDYRGQQDANQTNVELAREQMEFQERMVEKAQLADTLSAQTAFRRSQQSANEQMEFQKGMAKNAMDFEESMSSSAYQRAAKDMEKAGLNRILAAGGPSSTPSIGIPSGAKAEADVVKRHTADGALAHMESTTKGVSEKIIGSALDMVRLRKDVQEANSRISKNQQDAKTAGALQKVYEGQQEKVDSETEKVKADIPRIKAETSAKVLSKEIADAKTKVERAHPQLFGWYDAIAKRIPFGKWIWDYKGSGEPTVAGYER